MGLRKTSTELGPAPERGWLRVGGAGRASECCCPRSWIEAQPPKIGRLVYVRADIPPLQALDGFKAFHMRLSDQGAAVETGRSAFEKALPLKTLQSASPRVSLGKSHYIVACDSHVCYDLPSLIRPSSSRRDQSGDVVRQSGRSRAVKASRAVTPEMEVETPAMGMGGRGTMGGKPPPKPMGATANCQPARRLFCKPWFGRFSLEMDGIAGSNPSPIRAGEKFWLRLR